MVNAWLSLRLVQCNLNGVCKLASIAKFLLYPVINIKQLLKPPSAEDLETSINVFLSHVYIDMLGHTTDFLLTKIVHLILVARNCSQFSSVYNLREPICVILWCFNPIIKKKDYQWYCGIKFSELYCNDNRTAASEQGFDSQLFVPL